MFRDSPVKSDSFISTNPSTIEPSQTSWLPCFSSTMSDKTSSFAPICLICPSLKTFTWTDETTFNLSINLRALISWYKPIDMLATKTTTNEKFKISSFAIIIAIAIMNKRMLKKLKTFS